MPPFSEDEWMDENEKRRQAARWEAREDRRNRKNPNRDESWDLEDEGPDDKELVPDEFATVRCTQCRKLIFEETERCPYCKHYQLQDERDRKPIWMIATAVILIGAMGGFGALYILGLWPWT